MNPQEQDERILKEIEELEERTQHILNASFQVPLLGVIVINKMVPVGDDLYFKTKYVLKSFSKHLKNLADDIDKVAKDFK